MAGLTEIRPNSGFIDITLFHLLESKLNLTSLTIIINSAIKCCHDIYKLILEYNFFFEIIFPLILVVDDSPKKTANCIILNCLFLRV